ncbi:class I SAM-dependent methyltransferase [Aliiglaciecola sp. 2_MG-2023]|uniref:class I SAM-dependent methyltransferase n=1 Tax=unclassified Aliiglaciecola TaxID=2593648 RepID=UPI0026E153B5|nr:MULTISPECIES: class I SAM-dependent methyltransferase [unclassified Aliiglaciecola]MDO6709373.1 class I SAM-dependent methyltransferase [Aliiglaciecola sp. 2_MG-2023]MDO6750521.1 class I SAM-dependent methyltransferase [Aliiglaciecola sp. 1_MG-2023]
MLNQYGKPSSALLLQKQSFFKENQSHVKKQRNIAKNYIQQPLRKNCKNCKNKLLLENDFIKDTIPYKICRKCTHLNGAHEDTTEFCSEVYTENDAVYAENYEINDKSGYEYRTASIYSPKAEFLYTSLKVNNVDPNKLSYFDYGAGSGYFVSALRKLGLKDISGTEVSEYQVELANQMLEANLIQCHSINDSHLSLSNTAAQVVSMIGVLEHLQTPRIAMAALAKNKNVEYIFISVPTFSLSVYLELLDDNLFHRQLHGGHTHLFTEKSLNHLCNEFNFEVISQWWFGTDLVDLYRQLSVNLEQKNVSEYMKTHLKKTMTSYLDNAQLELDKQRQSSEVHMLLRKKID